jgi:hypothetical protein
MGKPMPDNEDFISGWDVEKMIRLGFKTNADFSDSCENATWLKPIIK